MRSKKLKLVSSLSISVSSSYPSPFSEFNSLTGSWSKNSLQCLHLIAYSRISSPQKGQFLILVITVSVFYYVG